MYSSWKKQPEVDYQEDWVILFRGHPWGYWMTECQKDAVPGECSGSRACLGVSLLSIKLVWTCQGAGREHREAQGKWNWICSLAVSSGQLHIAAFCTGWEGQGAQSRHKPRCWFCTLHAVTHTERKRVTEICFQALTLLPGITMLNSPTPIFTDPFPAKAEGHQDVGLNCNMLSPHTKYIEINDLTHLQRAHRDLEIYSKLNSMYVRINHLWVIWHSMVKK